MKVGILVFFRYPEKCLYGVIFAFYSILAEVGWRMILNGYGRMGNGIFRDGDSEWKGCGN